MKATDAYRQRLLAELIEQSARIDELVMKTREALPDIRLKFDKELEDLREKQRIITNKLHELEDPKCNVWENIGDGG